MKFEYLNLYVKLRPEAASESAMIQRPAKRMLNLKLLVMPLFSCGAIPQYISRESPSEKMHAHLRSFSFYRKIDKKTTAISMPFSESI